jgi:ankyrin repeat protein
MTEAEMRQWVEANPGHVDNRDNQGDTPLLVATCLDNLPLVVRLLDEKGADVNRKAEHAVVPLHGAESVDILNASMDRGADPTMVTDDGLSGHPL